MNTAHLISQLLEIEQAVGVMEPGRIRALLFEAEENVLRIEQQMIEILLENDRLRARLESTQDPSAATLLDFRAPAKVFIN